ncbi:hypothetical protein PN498_24545 [Oscillatoria sp. CS-180]|uniref:hypothetical protein n=1 Tax=Oscillatoria sp. CS-180 TaxID=3021720 RepID=UPI00232D96F9|nr:hypothetical protein [Oscillatoria sp. CS-180]MDB9529184.1 hypothetical protein [Oscillatoria sp. CS-180]
MNSNSVMHRYGFELRPNRVSELVEQLANCHPLFIQDVQKFCQFLMELERSLP